MTEETKEQPKGLFDKFMDLYAPLAQQVSSFSPQDYAQDFREKQNYVLKQLGLISPTSGVTTPENTRPAEDILLRNGSQDQPTMDAVEQYVNDRVNYNPDLGPVPVKDPNDPDEYRRNQMLEMMEINRMFDGFLQADDFALPTISVDQRAAYTSHLLSVVHGDREALAKKLVSKDLKALEGLDDINAFYAGVDRETQMENLEVPANIAAGVDGVDGVDGVMSSDTIQKGFDTLLKSEGPDIHLDQNGTVTLPYGIVPDKNSVKTADGTPFDPTAGKHNVGKDDVSGIDYSKATKFGVSREDFTTDEKFAKAVFDKFAAATKKKYGSGFKDLSESAKQVAYDLSWNGGTKFIGFKDVKAMLKEASKKDNADKSTDILIGFTKNFVSNNNWMRGLLKRRVKAYNLVAKPGEKATMITTTAIIENNKRTETKYDIKKSDGSVIKSWTKPDPDDDLGDLVVN